MHSQMECALSKPGARTFSPISCVDAPSIRGTRTTTSSELNSPAIAEPYRSSWGNCFAPSIGRVLHFVASLLQFLARLARSIFGLFSRLVDCVLCLIRAFIDLVFCIVFRGHTLSSRTGPDPVPSLC